MSARGGEPFTRTQAMVVGGLMFVVGVGMLLMDLFTDWLHFYSCIPFFILGPIVSGLGIFFFVSGALDRMDWLDR